MLLSFYADKILLAPGYRISYVQEFDDGWNFVMINENEKGNFLSSLSITVNESVCIPSIKEGD